jgi:hypothetical protein
MSTGIHGSITALHKGYVEDKNDTEAKLVTTLTFVAGTAYHADLTAKLCLLSKVLQKDHVQYKLIKSVVNATCTGISTAYVDLDEGQLPGGRKLQAVLNEMHQVLGAMEGDEQQSFEHGPDGHAVTVPFNQEKWQSLTGVMASYAKSQVQCLQRRFPDDELMEAFDVLDPNDFPRPLPNESISAFKRRLLQHGEAQLAKLVAEYGHAKQDSDGNMHAARVNAERTDDEYEAYKGLWWALEEKEALKPPAARQKIDHVYMLQHLFTGTDATFLPNIKKLLSIEAAQALITSCCERGISTLGIIKTKLRNCLLVATTDALMEIALNGPTEPEVIKMLCVEVFKLWRDVKIRMPQRSYKGKKPRKNAQAARPVIDELQDDGREASQQTGDDGSDEDEDEDKGGQDEDTLEDEEDEEDEGDQEDEDAEAAEQSHQASVEELLSRAPPFSPDDGWVLLSEPPASLTKATMKKLKVILKFTTGWWAGNFKGKITNKKSADVGKYNVWVPNEKGSTVGLNWAQPLTQGSYGPNRKWVLVKRG